MFCLDDFLILFNLFFAFSFEREKRIDFEFIARGFPKIPKEIFFSAFDSD